MRSSDSARNEVTRDCLPARDSATQQFFQHYRFLDEAILGLHETWRARLFQAQFEYAQNRNHETKAEYMRVLRTFQDLVFYGIVPRDQPVCTSEERRSLVGETGSLHLFRQSPT